MCLSGMSLADAAGLSAYDRQYRMTDERAVELVSVTKQFGGTVAVDQVSPRIPGGAYCCLLGPSGCGKTTTLRMIAGHETVSAGSVVFGGHEITDLPPARRGTAMRV